MQVGDYVEDPYITPAGDMLSRYNGVGFSTHDNKISNPPVCVDKNSNSGGS